MKRGFLAIADFSAEEIRDLLELAGPVKGGEFMKMSLV
jgi:hypothetical protein